MDGMEAAELAAERVRKVNGSAEGRLELAAEFYSDGLGRYGRAELSFLRWSIARGVLDEETGSAWWRAVNDRLLRDKTEARLRHGGRPGGGRCVELWGEFLRGPSATRWYRAHNASVVAAYLEHEHLAEAELPAERFMINVALVRVLYSHALVARPRLALGLLAPLGPLLADPRRGSVGLFLDMRRAFPQRYPLTGLTVEDLRSAEGGLPRALDYGLIIPRMAELYEFAGADLDQPDLPRLFHGYAAAQATRVNPRGLTRLIALATRPR